MPRPSDLTRVDDLLLRLVRTLRRPAYRNRILHGATRIPGAEALRVLRSVELREQRGERASIRDVAGDLEVEQSTASRAVNSLVGIGLVNRSSDANDLRRTQLSLSDDGREALGRATDNRIAVVAEVIRDWPDTDVREFVRMLDRFVAEYEAVEGPAAD